MPTSFDFWVLATLWLVPPVIAFFYSLSAAKKSGKAFYELSGFKFFVIGWLVVWGIIFGFVAQDFWDVWFTTK